MKITTRAYLGLWLISLAALGLVAFVIFAINVAARQDADRLRIAQVMDIHGSLWRLLVEMKHDQQDYALTGLDSLRESVERHKQSVFDYTTQLGQLVQDGDQVERLDHIRESVERWAAVWTQTARAPGRAAPVTIFEASERDFAPINTMLVEFADRQRVLWEAALDTLAANRRLFFTIITTVGAAGFLAFAFIMVATKRTVLDPLTELTETARRIEQGDFTAAHQTLRADEIGVLVNSFAKMVQAVQARERELAQALGESRELASVTAESRRRVEAAHADLLAMLETTPAALMIFNLDGSVRLRNRAATDVFGIEPQNPELRKNYWSRFKRVAKDGTPIEPRD